MVPIGTVIDQADRALHQVNQEELNKIQEYKNAFQECLMICKQIMELDKLLDRMANVKEKKDIQDILQDIK